MDDAPALMTASSGDPAHAKLIEIVEFLHAATAQFGEADDLATAQSMLMAATSMFAGTIMGTLIVAGIARDQDRKRATEAMARNFRSGIDVGKRRAMRIACEEFGGNA